MQKELNRLSFKNTFFWILESIFFVSVQHQISSDAKATLSHQQHAAAAALNPCINPINQSPYQSMWNTTGANSLFDPNTAVAASIAVSSSANAANPGSVPGGAHFAILPTSSSNQSYPGIPTTETGAVGGASATNIPASSALSFQAATQLSADGILHPMQANAAPSGFNYPMYFSPATLPLDLTGTQFDPKM